MGGVINLKGKSTQAYLHELPPIRGGQCKSARLSVFALTLLEYAFLIVNRQPAVYRSRLTPFLLVWGSKKGVLGEGHFEPVANSRAYAMPRVGQDRIYPLFMTVYLIKFLHKTPYLYRLYMVLANPSYAAT